MNFDNIKFFNKIVILFLFISIGCGKQGQSNSSEQSFLNASYLLDQRDYAQAIIKFEEIIKKDPTNQAAKVKLFHAYAGASGFESLKLIEILKFTENKINIVKQKKLKDFSQHINEDLQKNIDRVVLDLEEILEKIPVMDANQRKNLNHALRLYNSIGIKIDQNEKYLNFQWGTLHAFRLAVNLKEIVLNIKNSKDEKNNYHLNSVEKIILSHAKEIELDFIKIIMFYSHTYKKFSIIKEGLEEIIGKSIGSREFKLKIDNTIKDERKFIENFYEENVNHIGKILTLYIESSSSQIKKSVTNSIEFLPKQELIQEKRAHLQALLTITLRAFIQANPNVENALNSLFSLKNKEELLKAIEASFKLHNLNPLNSFLLSHNSQFKPVVIYVKILLGQLDKNDIDDEIKSDLNALKAKVNQELLKQELERLNRALNLIESSSETKTKQHYANDRSILETHAANLNERINEISDYLKTPVEKLNTAHLSKFPNDEKEQVEKILKSIFENK